jgi:hypothetical protein
MNWANVATKLKELSQSEEEIAKQIQSGGGADNFVSNRMMRSKIYLALSEAIEAGIK